MASKKLSSNQWTLLCHIAKGSIVPEYLRGRTLDSLLTSQLIPRPTQEQPAGTGRFGDPFRTITVVVLRLTPHGFNLYKERRTRSYEKDAAELKTEFDKDISKAQMRTG